MIPKKLKEIGCDGLVLAGAGVLCYGLWLAWHPLGFIAGGVAITAAGFALGYDRESMRRRS